MNLDLAQSRYLYAQNQTNRPTLPTVAAVTGLDYRGGNVVTGGYGTAPSRVLSNSMQGRGETVSYRDRLSVGRMG